MYEEFQKYQINQSINDAFIKSRINPVAIEKKAAVKAIILPKRSDAFSSYLKSVLVPSLSAKELIEKIVYGALEIEFGSTFTSSNGFDRMVSTVADTIITNPDLRRQALAIASIYISSKLDIKEETAQ